MTSEMMKREKIKVRLFFGPYKAEGEIVTIEGYRGRLSDMLNDNKGFINLVNAVVYDNASGKLDFKHEFLCVNKRFVIAAMQIE